MLKEFARVQPAQNKSLTRHNWKIEEAKDLFEMPFNDLLHQAQRIHRQNFDPNEIQLSALLNIKEGGCPEDCAYCPQSARYKTGVEVSGLMPKEEVIKAAKEAKDNGASRFCMGAAWRCPKDKDLQEVVEIVTAVKSMGMETCATLGMLTEAQAMELKNAGLDYYNHNLDTSADYYGEIISTRTFQDRLNTLEYVRKADMNVCCGGIIGLGEGVDQRASMLVTLANMPKHPESVPINLLVRIDGTPLADAEAIDTFDMVRIIAVARIMMPLSYVRLSAGRTTMSDGDQALCFHAGANSVFYGDKLLTTENPEHQKDMALFQRLGLKAKA